MEQLHKKALSLAKAFKRAQIELMGVLEKIDSCKGFVGLGYSSLFEYCVRCLKLSESDTYTLIRVSRKSKQLPELKQALVMGKITVSAAKRVASVITSENQASWIHKAATLSQQKLEREVVKSSPKLKVPDRMEPVSENFTAIHGTLDAESEKLLKQVQDLESQRLKKHCDLNAAIQAMAKTYLKVHVRAPKPKKMTVSLRTLNKRVTLRDGRQCVFVDLRGQRCTQRRWLDVHHIRPKSIGGKDTADNLALLCKNHHRAIHQGVRYQKLIVGEN